jgi:hypothetical protein
VSRVAIVPLLTSVLLVGIVAAGIVFGAETGGDPSCENKSIEARVIAVRYKPLSEASAVVEELLGPCGAVRVPKSSRLLTVEDEPGRLDRIARALSAWDTPPRAVDMSISLILATRDPAPPGGIAKELRGVSESLSQLTRYTSFKLLSSTTLRAMEGKRAEAALGERYSVAFRVASVDRERGVVSIETFDLLEQAAAGEAGASGAAPRTILRLELALPHGREELVGAPGRRQDRAIFIAIKAVDAGDGIEGAAGPGR